MKDKLRLLLYEKFNIFHTDLILSALDDNSIDKWDFLKGVRAISLAEASDKDEFVPVQFEHLV